MTLSQKPSETAVDREDALLYKRVMEAAKRRETSPRELYAEALKLLRPGMDEAERQRDADRYADHLQRCDSGEGDRLDSMGNPLWISLTLPERHDENGIAPSDILPSEAEQAGPTDRLETPRAARFSARGKDSGPKSNGLVPPLKPQPMRSFVRMLLLVAVMGAVYYFLIRRGWITNLF